MSSYLLVFLVYFHVLPVCTEVVQKTCLCRSCHIHFSDKTGHFPVVHFECFALLSSWGPNLMASSTSLKELLIVIFSLIFTF